MGEDEQLDFIDAEQYISQGPKKKSYEQLVLEQIERCVKEGSKEMKGGYFKEKETSKGKIEIYIEDQRKVYIQCITSLYDLLLPYFDSEMNDIIIQFNQEKDSIKEDIILMLKKKKENVSDLREVRKIEEVMNTGFLDINSYESYIAMERSLELYRELYQELLLLFNRKRHLMASEISDA